MSQIICKDLAIGYNNIVLAQNINFTVNTGDYLCITGCNGSGKSTLIKAILGLIKPLSGSLTFGDGLTKNSIGYLPQKNVFQNDFPASVEEIVLSGFLGKKRFNSFYTKSEKQKIKEVLQLLGIENLQKKSFLHLSGGQMQKVLLARALCACNGLLVLDEPVSALDPESQKEMYKIVDMLNTEHNISVIMISHDITGVNQYAKQILQVGNNE